MKRINILVFIATALLLTGCKDNFFSTESPSAMDETSVFSSARETEQVIAGIYAILGEQNSYRSRLGGYWVSYNTDIEWHNGGNDYTDYSMTKDGDSNGDLIAKDKHPWAYLMSAIERANLCIDGIEQYGDTTDANIRYLWGEALTLRAWLYYEMTKLWGDVPCRFHSLDVNTTQAIYVTKSDRNLIYDQLRIDLRKAIELMPFSQEIAWGNAKNNVERMNKQFACGLLARIDLVYAGKGLRPDNWVEGGGSSFSVQLNTKDPNLRSELLGEAVKYTEMVINYDGAFIGGKLLASYEDVFKNICANEKMYSKSETLWEIPFMNNVRGQFLNRMGAYVNKRAMSYLLHTTPTSKSNAKISLTPQFVFSLDADDTRKWVTIAPYEWDYRSDDNKPISAATGEELGSDPVLYQKPDAANKFYLAKFRYEWLTYDVDNDDDGLNIPVMRYSDILLMYAEAMIGGISGDEPNYKGAKSATEIFNLVRERAYGSKDHNVTNLTMDTIMLERAKEFAGEHIRKYDLMRWGVFGKKMTEAERIFELFGSNSSRGKDTEGNYIFDMNGTEYYGHVNPYVYIKIERDDSYANKSKAYKITDIYGLSWDEMGTPPGYSEEAPDGWSVKKEFWLNDGSPVLSGARLFKESVASEIENHQYWPIFTIILSSNPNLWNDYGY